MNSITCCLVDIKRSCFFSRWLVEDEDIPHTKDNILIMQFDMQEIGNDPKSNPRDCSPISADTVSRADDVQPGLIDGNIICCLFAADYVIVKTWVIHLENCPGAADIGWRDSNCVSQWSHIRQGKVSIKHDEKDVMHNVSSDKSLYIDLAMEHTFSGKMMIFYGDACIDEGDSHTRPVPCTLCL